MSGAQAATAVSASMDLKATVSLNGATDTQVDNATWANPLDSLSVAVDARQLDPNVLHMFANAFGSGGSNWVSADEGSVGFKGLGWQFDVDRLPVSADLSQGDPNWRYVFVADADDVAFSMNFQISGVGDVFGLQGWQIRIEGGPEGLRTGAGLYPQDPTQAGTFTASLTAGQTYTVSLVNNANLSAGNGAYIGGAMHGNFDWHIDQRTVPEPGSLGLVACALLGLYARRPLSRSASRVAR